MKAARFGRPSNPFLKLFAKEGGTRSRRAPPSASIEPSVRLPAAEAGEGDPIGIQLPDLDSRETAAIIQAARAMIVHAYVPARRLAGFLRVDEARAVDAISPTAVVTPFRLW